MLVSTQRKTKLSRRTPWVASLFLCTTIALIGLCFASYLVDPKDQRIAKTLTDYVQNGYIDDLLNGTDFGPVVTSDPIPFQVSDIEGVSKSVEAKLGEHQKSIQDVPFTKYLETMLDCLPGDFSKAMGTAERLKTRLGASLPSEG